MLFPNKNRDLEELEELNSLQNQVKTERLEKKLSKQNFHDNIKKYLIPLLNHLKIHLKI